MPVHRSHRKRKDVVYVSWRHVFVTLFVIVLPFVFFLVYSRLAHIASSTLFYDLLISVARLAAAYAIAVVIAWVCAALFYKGKASIIALPIFDVLQSFPTFAALPLAVFYWGSNNFTVIFFLVTAVIWPIFFSLISSLKSIRRDWEEAVEISRLKGFSYIKNFLWPISLPALVTGSIIGLGDGWEALVATEIIVRVRGGLGNFFGMYASDPTITVFGILGFLIFIFSISKLIWLPLLERSHAALDI